MIGIHTLATAGLPGGGLDPIHVAVQANLGEKNSRRVLFCDYRDRPFFILLFSLSTSGVIMTKYILVSGGVVSGIGKGVIGATLHSGGFFNELKLSIVASSTGLLLKTAGLKVTAIKIDPYMNIDAGTMRPTEHGEPQAAKAD